MCLLFFISTWTRFYSIGKDSLSNWRLFEMRDVATVICGLPVVCHWNGQCCSLLLRVTAPLQSYSLSIVTPFLPLITPPPLPSPLQITTHHHCHISVRGFWSHLTLRTWSVFLILTKINLLFSRWILRACKCCDSHIQQLSVKWKKLLTGMYSKCFVCEGDKRFLLLSTWVFCCICIIFCPWVSKLTIIFSPNSSKSSNSYQRSSVAHPLHLGAIVNRMVLICCSWNGSPFLALLKWWFAWEHEAHSLHRWLTDSVVAARKKKKVTVDI